MLRINLIKSDVEKIPSKEEEAISIKDWYAKVNIN